MKKLAVTLMILLNIGLIFLIIAFFKYRLSLESLLRLGGIILIGGVLGLMILVILTSGLKVMAKYMLVTVIISVCVLGGIYYFSQQQTVSERYYAVVVNEEDLSFTEYWFDTEGMLINFLRFTHWYGKDDERRGVFDYYRSIKGGEMESGETYIDKVYVDNFMPQAEGKLIAYVNESVEYEGLPSFFKMLSQPRYVISPSGETYPPHN